MSKLYETTIFNIVVDSNEYEAIGMGIVPDDFVALSDGIGIGIFKDEIFNFYYNIDKTISTYKNMLCQVDFYDGISIKFYKYADDEVSLITMDYWDAISNVMDDETINYDAIEASISKTIIPTQDYLLLLTKYDFLEYLPNDLKEIFIF